MAHFRVVRDAAGRSWDVWESRPSIVDRRDGRERRGAGRGDDRRQFAEERVPVPASFRKGWLCFQCGDEWRRVAPIPRHWYSLSDNELMALSANANASQQTQLRP
jgi:hypothetical protein